MLLAAFKVLLRRYTGQDDLVVGSSAANRDAESERLIGPFANPLALRTEQAPCRSSISPASGET